MIKFNPDPATHRDYEWVPTSAIRPGDLIRHDIDSSPFIVTAVRVGFHPHGWVTIYREPTNEEYQVHVERHDTDLRAAWASSSAPDHHVLKAVPPQSGDLAY